MIFKYLRSVLWILPVMVGWTAMAADAPRFMSAIDDLPLMAELQEIGDGVQFTTPQGRIAEITASGMVTKATVLAFYVRILPQLGWTAVSAGKFAREGETLVLVFENTPSSLNVRFALAPTITKK